MEEGAISLQRNAEVFRGYLVAAIPLVLQPVALPGEALCQALDGVGHQFIGLLHRPARLIDEAGLDLLPARPEIVGHFGWKQLLGALRRGLRLDWALVFAARGARNVCGSQM